MQPSRYSTLVLLLPLAIALAGCSGDPSKTRLPVTGTVSFKGQAVAQGSINFFAEQGGALISGAPIESGKFSIPADKGLPPGNYTVRITSASSAEPKEIGGTQPAEAKELIPAKYNTESTLKREVKQGQTNFDFNL